MNGIPDITLFVLIGIVVAVVLVVSIFGIRWRRRNQVAESQQQALYETKIEFPERQSEWISAFYNNFALFMQALLICAISFIALLVLAAPQVHYMDATSATILAVIIIVGDGTGTLVVYVTLIKRVIGFDFLQTIYYRQELKSLPLIRTLKILNVTEVDVHDLIHAYYARHPELAQAAGVHITQ